jgi:hypothetical protein
MRTFQVLRRNFSAILGLSLMGAILGHALSRSWAGLPEERTRESIAAEWFAICEAGVGWRDDGQSSWLTSEPTKAAMAPGLAREVVARLYQGGRLLASAYANRSEMNEAVWQACRALQPAWPQKIGHESAEPVFLKLDHITTKQRIYWPQRIYLAWLARNAGRGFLWYEHDSAEPIYRLPDELTRLNPGDRRHYFEHLAETLRSGAIQAFTIRSQAWLAMYTDNGRRCLSPADMGESSRYERAGLFPIVRGNVLPPTLARVEVQTAINAAAEYLRDSLDSTGRFRYEYDPVTDRPTRSPYNILRHAGSAYALFQAERLTPERGFGGAGERALRALVRKGQKSSVGKIDPAGATLAPGLGAVRAIVEANRAKLGGTALTVIALLEGLSAYHCDTQPEQPFCREFAPLIAEFGQFLLLMQQADGSFVNIYLWREKKADPADRQSIYYPGEATLALVRLFVATRDNRYLVAAKRAADQLLGRWKFFGLDIYVPPDAWLMQALQELYRITGQAELAHYCFKIANFMITFQYRPEDAPNHADMVGGFFDPLLPRTCPAAARGEGLGAALTLALAGAPLSNGLSARTLAESLDRLHRFLLGQQLRPENSYALAPTGLGGFRESPVSMLIRIDYCQHAISSLITLNHYFEQFSALLTEARDHDRIRP